ncbi:MAG: heimdallarchaeosortase [Candidatus Kariarchaeaceae archaeon]|jgi:exosortase/archaeosortase family protein
MSDLLPTVDNPHPLLKLEGSERKYYTIRTVLITAVMTIVIYLIPSYYGLEHITTQTSYFMLDIFGFHPRLFVYEDNLEQLTGFDQFMYFLYDSERATYPAISLDSDANVRRNYLIVRACTGMQAGALLLGLIWSTPASTHDRIRASYTILIALFIGNTMRIAAMIALTTIFIENFGLSYNDAWMYSHDWLGRPLGFFGTIGFTALIEMRNVRILDTITVWIDTIMGSKPKTAAD